MIEFELRHSKRYIQENSVQSFIGALWVAKVPMVLHTDSKGWDQTK